MSILNPGTTVSFIFAVVFGAIVGYFMYMAGKNQYPLRSLPQIEAIEGGVDRAVEEGKTVVTTPGSAALLQGMLAPMSIAGFNVLRYVVRMCVKKGARPILQVPMNPQSVGLIDGIYREACVAEGKPEAYRREDVIFAGLDDMAVFSTIAGVTSRLGVALYCVVGAEYSAGVHVAADCSDKGALVIGGTARYAHQGNWAMLADYPLFADDVYAAGAFCSQNNFVAASLWGLDISKLIMLGLLFVGLATALAGIDTYCAGTGWLYK